MARSDIAKQASLQDIARDAVEAAGKSLSELDLRHHPFRSLFKTLAPAALWLGGKWWLGILLGVAEEFLGGGASTLGDWIDKALGFGDEMEGSISDAGLKGAAAAAIDKLFGTTMARSSAFRESVLKRGCVETEDLLVAWAAGPDKTFVKEAGAFGNWFRWLKQTGRGKRLPLVGLLYQLLKTLVAGLGIHAGIKFVRRQFNRPEPFGLPIGMPGAGGSSGGNASGARMSPAAGFAEWENAGGVERSITMALDKAVKDRRGRPFSTLFAEMTGQPLRGSPAMERLLEDIRLAHGEAPLREIDRYRYFMAPPIAEVARRLLPQMTYSQRRPAPGKQPQGAAGPDAEAVLGRILGGGRK
jgi:hypothetical protein